MKLLERDFTFIPIKEMTQYVISQIGCSKNKWGKEVIRKINKMQRVENYGQVIAENWLSV